MYNSTSTFGYNECNLHSRCHAELEGIDSLVKMIYILRVEGPWYDDDVRAGNQSLGASAMSSRARFHVPFCVWYLSGAQLSAKIYAALLGGTIFYPSNNCILSDEPASRLLLIEVVSPYQRTNATTTTYCIMYVACELRLLLPFSTNQLVLHYDDQQAPRLQRPLLAIPNLLYRITLSSRIFFKLLEHATKTFQTRKVSTPL